MSRPGELMTTTQPRTSAAVVFGALLVAAPLIVVVPSRPLTALLVVVGVAVVALAALRTDVAVLILVFIGPLEGAFVSTSAQLSPTKIAGLLCFASFAVAAVRGMRIHLDRSHVLLFVLFGVAAISTLLSESMDEAVIVTARYASFVALYVVITQFAGDHLLLRRVAWALSISATIAAVIALNVYLFGNQDFRATLPGADANDLGFTFVTTLPLTFWLLKTPWPSKALPAGMIGIISAATLLTFSRGAMLGAAVGLVWAALTERPRVTAVVPAVFLTALVVILVVRSDPDRLDDAFAAKENVAQRNVNERLDAWRNALNMAADRPLVGVGPGNFAFRYHEFNDSPVGTVEPTVVHNAYLDVAAELGVTGLALFVSYLGLAFARATRARTDGRGPPGLASAVRTALLIGMVSAITLSEQYFAPFWVLGALATLLWLDAPREEAADAGVGRPSPEMASVTLPRPS